MAARPASSPDTRPTTASHNGTRKTPTILSQRDDGIDASRAHRGNQRGACTGRDDAQKARGVGHGVKQAHYCPNRLSSRSGQEHDIEHGAAPAGEQSDAHRASELSEHEPADVSIGRAERHPHADLPGALLDQIRENAEETRQRQKKRQGSDITPTTWKGTPLNRTVRLSTPGSLAKCRTQPRWLKTTTGSVPDGSASVRVSVRPSSGLTPSA